MEIEPLKPQIYIKFLNQNFHRDLKKLVPIPCNKLKQSIDNNFNPCNAISMDFDIISTHNDQSVIVVPNILDSKLPIHRIAAITGTLKRLSLEPSEISNIIQGNFNSIDQVFNLLQPDSAQRLNLIKGILPIDSQVKMLDKCLLDYLESYQSMKIKGKPIIFKGVEHFIDIVGRIPNRFQVISGMIAIESYEFQLNQFKKIIKLWEEGSSIVQGSSSKIAIILSAMSDICCEMNQSKQKIRIHIDSWLDVFMIKSKLANSKLVFGDIVLRILIQNMNYKRKDLQLFSINQQRKLKNLSAVIHSSVLQNINELINDVEKNIQTLKKLTQIKQNCLKNYFIEGYQFLKSQIDQMYKQSRYIGERIEAINNYFHITQQEQTNYIFKKIHEFSICLKSRLELVEGSESDFKIKEHHKLQSRDCKQNAIHKKTNDCADESIFYSNQNKENLFEVSNQHGIFRNKMKKRVLKTQYFLENSSLCKQF